MFKKISALIFLLALSFSQAGATEYNPYSLNYLHTNTGYEAQVYKAYGNTSYNFFYQLRDVTGAARSDNVGGSQWFATVYENYYYYFNELIDTDEELSIYRRTMGGEIPDITFNTVGDIIDGFNFIFAEEPQPYETEWRRYINWGVFDVYPDPIESLCIVTTNGQGDFNIKFGNPYAREFPFWWNWSTTSTAQTGEKWWQQHISWKNTSYPTTEPIAYIYSEPDIYKLSEGFTDYVKVYTYTISTDASGDVAGRYINDTSDNIVYTISGDINGVHYFYNTEDTLVYTVSGDRIYNSAGNFVYTIEKDATNSDLYICEIRDVNESIAVTGFDDDYNVSIQPSNEQAISSGNSLGVTVRLRGDSNNYGSKLGYLTFRQRASFASGYSNYREFATIPMVIANVAEGNAEEEPLIFDMRIYDTDNKTLVARKKFTWDVQSNIQEDLGTLFVTNSSNEDAENQDTPVTTYNLETRITNRSGTRYELYRYDGIGSRNGDVEYRDDYASIMPDHWKYDLTRDSYGTLPDYFLLDAKSQIAPGLVTVYKENIDEGYRTMPTGNVITDSFRLYEYNNPLPRNLSLKHRRIKGMTIPAEIGTPQTRSGSDGESSSVQAFNMDFANNNVNNAALLRLARLVYKTPAIIPIDILTSISPVSPQRPDNNTGSDTTNSFQIKLGVPDGFVNYEVIEISDDVEPEENGENTPPEEGGENEQGGEDEPENASVFTVSEFVYSTDKMAVLPFKVRLTLPKNNIFINNYWKELNEADSDSVFDIFSRLASVYVRVPNTIASDGAVDLFKALNTAENRGGVQGATARDFVNVTVDDENDKLYVDFIVFLADATAPDARQNVNPLRPVVSSFIYTFEDDGVPYMLIGDGDVDKVWNLTFYVAAPDTSTASSSVPTEEEVKNFSESSSSGTCNIEAVGILGLALLMFKVKKFK